MRNILLTIAIVSLSVNGFLIYRMSNIKNAPTKEQEQFPLLSKRIFTENQNDILVNFIPLRTALKEYVGKQADKVGVYFEYLPSGTSIGVNDKTEVALASLSKVPIVMQIFKKIEREQLALDDVLTVEKKHLNQQFGTLWKRGEGVKLSVRELIKISLMESDNTAANVLTSQLEDAELNEVYRSLDIAITINSKEPVGYLRVAPKNYSSIFRSLYLSSFLSKENSNYILDILSQTIFKDKIPAGVPESITVAHKVGIFEDVNTKMNVYVDCGIVYVPSRPYVLCAFVQDTDKQAQKHISHISKIIYEYVEEVEGGK